MGIWHFFVELARRLGMTFMRCSSRPSRAREIGAGRRLASAVAIAFALAVMAATPTQAQITLVPAPTPTPSRTDIDYNMSAGAAVTNLGSNFLERLGNQATYGFGGALRNNPGGGGSAG